MKLQDCLLDTPKRTLEVIAGKRQIPIGKRSKSDLATFLVEPLLDPTRLRYLLDTLTVAERAALQALQAQGGRMALAPFAARFGPIRPYRPWLADAPRDVGEAGAPPAERLAYLGLLFPIGPEGKDDTALVVLPQELRAIVPVAPWSRAAELGPPLDPSPDVNPRLDLALLLSLIHRAQVHPQHRYWLPRPHLLDWNERLRLPEPPASLVHESRAGRLRFVHFLAEVAGLLTYASDGLQLTLEGWAWLRASAPEQLRALWQRWQMASATLWQRYRLPGGAQPALPSLLAALARVPEGPLGVATFTGALVAQEPALWELALEWEDDQGRYGQAAALVAALLCEPLAWWGVIALSPDEQRFAVTPLGRWLLGVGPQPLMADHGRFGLASDWSLAVPPDVAPLTLLQVESVSEWRGHDGENRRYALTPATLRGALARGMPLADVLRLLHDHSVAGLSVLQRATLRQWATTPPPLRLRRLTVLEGEPAQLQALVGQRTLRCHFHRSLSPRALVVNEARLSRLQSQLARHALPVAGLELPPSVPPAPHAALDPAALDPAAAARLLVAGRVYQALGDWIALPQPLPAATLRALEQQLDPPARELAAQLARDTLAALAEALDGRPASAPPGEGLPPEETLPLIEEAICDGRELHLRYRTFGRGVLTERVVEPHLLAWHGSVPYLHGWCHLAGAERTFRLDRIEALALGDSLEYPF